LFGYSGIRLFGYSGIRLFGEAEIVVRRLHALEGWFDPGNAARIHHVEADGEADREQDQKAGLTECASVLLCWCASLLVCYSFIRLFGYSAIHCSE
jgi:hypothetical protein